jgi:regulator of nonsense transcripts 1
MLMLVLPGWLQNGAGAGDRIGGAPAFPWPKPDKPMMFWAQLGPEEISASGEPVARS